MGRKLAPVPQSPVETVGSPRRGWYRSKAVVEQGQANKLSPKLKDQELRKKRFPKKTLTRRGKTGDCSSDRSRVHPQEQQVAEVKGHQTLQVLVLLSSVQQASPAAGLTCPNLDHARSLQRTSCAAFKQSQCSNDQGAGRAAKGICDLHGGGQGPHWPPAARPRSSGHGRRHNSNGTTSTEAWNFAPQTAVCCRETLWSRGHAHLHNGDSVGQTARRNPEKSPLSASICRRLCLILSSENMTAQASYRCISCLRPRWSQWSKIEILRTRCADLPGPA